MRHAPATLLALGLAALPLLDPAAAGAQAPVPAVPDLVAAEARAHRGCEGGGDPAVARGLCALRDRLSGRLAQAGWCWGRKGQTEATRDWHPCGPDSVTVDDVEAAR